MPRSASEAGSGTADWPDGFAGSDAHKAQKRYRRPPETDCRQVTPDLSRASVVTTLERAHTLSPSSERSGSSNPAEEGKLQSIQFQINTVTKIYRSTKRSAAFSLSLSVGL
jgi:hypothetical protein